MPLWSDSDLYSVLYLAPKAFRGASSTVRPTWPSAPLAASPASSITFCPIRVVSPISGFFTPCLRNSRSMRADSSSLVEANLALTQEIPPFNLFDNTKTVYSRARMLPPAKISGTTLEKTIIAEGSIIHASRIEQSVVGIRSRIGHGTTVVSTYIMGNDYYETIEEMELNTSKGLPKIGIGERCYIKDAIIDKNCRIGNDVRINGGSPLPNTDHPLYTMKDGIVVVKKTAILPDGFVIYSFRSSYIFRNILFMGMFLF